MPSRSPRLRRRLAATLLPLLTLASAGTLAARAGTDNSNNADLAITKTATPNPVAVGGQITYTLIVTNNGPRPGTQVRIHDALPSGVAFVSADVTRKSTPSDFCNRSGGVVDCTIHGNVRPDGSDSVVVTIVGTVTSRPATGQVCNTASVTGNHDDPDPDNNNTSTVCTTIAPPSSRHADLSITKTADKDRVSIGEALTYTVTVSNAGPDTAANPQITDVLPADVEFVSVMPGSPTCGQAGGVVSCSLGPIAKDGKSVVTIRVKPTADAGGQTITNCASVAAGEEDSNLENNEACVPTAVRARADLSITKTADKPVALIGEVLTYTITVHNDGPNAATGVGVTDDLPSQAALQSASASQGSCGQTDPVTCSLGSLDSGTSATVTIKVKPTAKGFITNTASVTTSGKEEDPTPADRSSSVTTVYGALTGGAFGESIDVRTLLGLRVQSGPLASVTLPPAGGGPFTGSAVNLRVGAGLYSDLLRLDLLRASTEGGHAPDGGIFVASSADVAKASLVNGLITVDGLHSDCRTDNVGGSSSSANVVNLRIAGLQVNVASGPNSTVTVPGVGQLILNEQVTTGTGPMNQARVVNALHLKLDGLLAKGDVILAHSDCGIDP